MQQLNNLSDDADQLMVFVLPDGSPLSLEFIYRPAMARWVMNLTHPLLTLRGYNLVVCPNILRQWSNLIPFGIAILSTIGLDPIFPQDLQTGAVTINILTAAEVAVVNNEILVPEAS